MEVSFHSGMAASLWLCLSHVCYLCVPTDGPLLRLPEILSRHTEGQIFRQAEGKTLEGAGEQSGQSDGRRREMEDIR